VTDYYAKKLSGQRLARCYKIAPPRVQQYLEAEIAHVCSRLKPADTVLELGCGYGRVTMRLAARAARVVGIDNAEPSLELARRIVPPQLNCAFLHMDAIDLEFTDGSFDVVVCVQNGICAFGVDPRRLLREALRVTRPGGRALFSTYAEQFWPHRLAWFELQAQHGLLGPIDHDASRDGVIVCQDGFRAGRLTAAQWHALCRDGGVTGTLTEVDGSCLFCELIKPAGACASRDTS
jgi:2-polyprenyl-6-hydroxyphenyl methylase/3-demethylubiquinone-9 3-methyltransferase